MQVMFLFTDAHVANESFLELINNMLTSGMIPALYDDGEKDALITGIREEVWLRLYFTHACVVLLTRLSKKTLISDSLTPSLTPSLTHSLACSLTH